jgi:iron complex outermembrane recepter protein
MRREHVPERANGAAVVRGIVAISLLTPVAHSAQTGAPLEEVVVTGIRMSVDRSVADKRALDVVADVIAAEDIGKFPDKNVAEALQRVTGVQITREANEGKFVNVRGLPSEFTYVTLNGQAVTSASDAQIVQGTDRNFDFSLLTPEFVDSLAVYKTPRANLEEGGVAATVDLQTVRPFGLGARRMVFSAQAQKYDLKGEPEPHLAGLYSDVWFDGRAGLTVGAAWNRRFFQTQATDTSQLDRVAFGGGQALILDNDSINFNDQLRDTRSYYAAFQIRPSDSVVASLISLHARFNGDSRSGSFALRPGLSFDAATFDTELDSSGVLTRAVGPGIYVGASNFHQWDRARLDNHQLQLEWSSGLWNVKNVLAYSESTTHSRELGFAVQHTGVTGGYEIVAGEPVATFIVDPGFDVGDPGAYTNGYIGGNVLDRSDRLGSEQLDVIFKGRMGAIESVEAGLRFAQRRRENGAFFLLDLTQHGTDIGRFAARSPVQGSPFLAGDPPYYDERLYLDTAFEGSYGNWARAATTQKNLDPSNQYRIEENTSAAYAMARFRFEAWRPIRGNLGARVVKTQQEIGNFAVDFSAVRFNKLPPPAPSVTVPAASAQSFDRSYTDVLPSLNVIVDLTENLSLRAAAARVLSRPTLESLVPRYSVSVDPDVVTGGNPNLDPFRAKQYDLSLEWYFRPGSLLSIAGYDKEIESFIRQGTEPFDIMGRTFTRVLPVNGRGGYVRGAELGYTQAFDFLPSFWSGLGVQANVTYARGEAVGLSRYTYNFVAFYEKHGASFRLGYNDRGTFLSDADIRGQGTSVAYTQRFATLDLAAAYDLSNHVSLFVEGNNLLRKETVSSLSVIDGDGGRLPLTWAVGDRRLALGLRVEL